MACLEPTTVSPGKLVLHYLAPGIGRMSIGWHFINGVDLTDVVHIRTEADRIANLLKDCLPPLASITDWSITEGNGFPYYNEPFASAYIGTHTVNGNMQEYYSTTVAFVGHAQAPSPGGCAGRLVSRLHTFGALNFAPGTKFFDASADSPYAHFISNALNASTYLPADGYGQQGNIGGIMPVQFNAAVQRRVGT